MALVRAILPDHMPAAKLAYALLASTNLSDFGG
jgi:hypothetical protein